MKNHRVWIACSLFAAVGFALAGLSQPNVIGQEPAVKPVFGPAKWEYKVVGLSFEQKEQERDKMLGEIGKEGWELCAAAPYGNSNVLYFKRDEAQWRKPAVKTRTPN